MICRTIAIAFLGLLVAGSPAAAQSDDQVIATFEDHPIGTSDITIGNALFQNHITGGSVAAAAASNPAHSGTQVYGGRSISFATENEADFSWPGVGAWVSGSATIWLQTYEYDYDLGADTPSILVSIGPGASDVYLSVGSFDAPRFITRATFYSDSAFTIDDLTLGIPGLTPGIPEPASWAMMACGFGLVGGALRSRLKAEVRFA